MLEHLQILGLRNWPRLFLLLFSTTGLVCLGNAQQPKASTAPNNQPNAAGAFAFEDTTLALRAGSSDGNVTVWVRWDKAPADAEKSQPTILDHTSSAGPTRVVFSEAQPPNRKRLGDQVEWEFVAQVSGLIPNTSQNRKASISLESTSTDVSYTITNVPAGSFTWSVSRPPSQWIISANPNVNLMVAAGDRSIAAVRLVQSTLQDAASKHQITPSQFVMCMEGDAECQKRGEVRCRNLTGGASLAHGQDNTVYNIPARRSTPITLALCPNFTDPGVFTGALTLSTSEDSSTQSVQLTVFSSSSHRYLRGGVLICLGLFLWFMVAVVFRTLYNRNQLRMPFADLKDTIEKLRGPVTTINKKTGVDLSKVKEGLDFAQTEVERNAQAAVPGGLSTSGSNIATPDQNYQAKLNASKDVVAVQVAIMKAVQNASERWNEDPQQQASVKKALQALNDLDQQTRRPTNQQDAEAQIKPITEELTKAFRLVSLAEPSALASVRELRLRNEQLDYVTWGLWFAITIALGLYLLVDTQPGFGTSTDLWKCFFWGLGISVAGQQFNPSTVTTALSVTLPRA